MGKKYVLHGATLECSMGATPTKLIVSMGHNLYMQNKPVANTGDCKLGVNVLPFGTCKMGKPKPCVPVLFPSWVNGKMDVLIGDMQPLLEDSILICSMGGTIKIKDSGQ